MLEQLEVTSVTIKLPFRLNHVNCFLAEGETGWTIIDTGIHNQESHNKWKEYLDEREISDIIVTHYHPDHYGFAGKLQELTCAKVSMTETDYDAVLEISKREEDGNLKENYMKCGVPDDLIEKVLTKGSNFNEMVKPHASVNRFLKEGDKIKFGKYEYEVLDAPGHSDGLVCFFNKEQSVLFSTDHILPKITPNISYHFYGEKNPLQKYLDSLERFKTLNAEYVIPSHGKPFLNANKRIDEIIRHHEIRCEQILDKIKTPSTVYEICVAVFGADMSYHDFKFALGETISHLEYLKQRGECSNEQEKSLELYKL